MKKVLVLNILLFCIILIYHCKGYNGSIYIIKKAWHTGIILKINELTLSALPVLNNFKEYQYADIGWGDEEFYQEPGFDALLAAKALFMPTSSVIRVEGYDDLKIIYEEADFFVELKLSRTQLIKLSEYISRSLIKSNPKIKNKKLSPSKSRDSEFIITSSRLGGKIRFYKSNQIYHLFHTCNTWVAEALEYAGLDINPFIIVTAERLYYDLKKIGKVRKYKEMD